MNYYLDTLAIDEPIINLVDEIHHKRRRIKRDDCDTKKTGNCLHCDNKALYSYDKLIAIHCFYHKLSGMKDIISGKCISTDCTKYASYNYPDKKSKLYCASHKLPDMILKRTYNNCSHVGCKKNANYKLQASYNDLGVPGVKFCSIHKQSGMIAAYGKNKVL